jgi:translation initiation factor 3 subunit C
MITIILRMDEEFSRILQNTDVHSPDYLERLKDELRIFSIINHFKTLLETTNNNNNHLCTIYMCIIEHIYYKYDHASLALINQLCKFIYTNDTFNRSRARANLCHVYNLALHDHYHEARDLMLMCHMQDTINSSDISTQILYNRTIVQLGLCAFRFGAIHEAHQALVDIQSGYRVKELLGQGVYVLENQETNLPFHMHINLELIECVYLISAMLIEVPFMASKLAAHQSRSISKHFYILMRQAEKQPISGPPESMREHVVSASYAMKTGDWKACIDFLINEKMNSKVSRVFDGIERDNIIDI